MGTHDSPQWGQVSKSCQWRHNILISWLPTSISLKLQNYIRPNSTYEQLHMPQYIPFHGHEFQYWPASEYVCVCVCACLTGRVRAYNSEDTGLARGSIVLVFLVVHTLYLISAPVDCLHYVDCLVCRYTPSYVRYLLQLVHSILSLQHNFALLVSVCSLADWDWVSIGIHAHGMECIVACVIVHMWNSVLCNFEASGIYL